jgi:hypothetical protein
MRAAGDRVRSPGFSAIIDSMPMPMPHSARIAAALWIVWAVVVWNVVLDQVIVVAGRRYIIAAIASAGAMGPFVRMDDWMRPAAVRGFWLATLAAAAILAIGFISLRLATRSPQPS